MFTQSTLWSNTIQYQSDTYYGYFAQVTNSFRRANILLDAYDSQLPSYNASWKTIFYCVRCTCVFSYFLLSFTILLCNFERLKPTSSLRLSNMYIFRLVPSMCKHNPTQPGLLWRAGACIDMHHLNWNRVSSTRLVTARVSSSAELLQVTVVKLCPHGLIPPLYIYLPTTSPCNHSPANKIPIEPH